MSFLERLFGAAPEPEEEPDAEPEVPQTLPAPDERTLAGFVRVARDAGASDVHFSAGGVPCARVEGALLPFETHELAPGEADGLALDLCERGGLPRDHDVDLCVELPDLGRVRANVHHQRRGWGAALKLVPLTIPTIAELDLPDELLKTTEHRHGLVLVTGPSGCGKSSTLAALVGHVNRTRADHVVTIEDPIEYVFESDLANVTQRQLGAHTSGFAGALRAALREDPDVILVSELRDLDTIRTAILAAETGHLVLGTLHTRGAISTVNRMLDLFPGRERAQVRTMLAATLRTVISQRLLPREGGGRRVVAYEILHSTLAVANHIREERTHQIPSLLQTGRRTGMIDLDTCLLQRVKQGVISRDTARSYAIAKDRFEEAG